MRVTFSMRHQAEGLTLRVLQAAHYVFLVAGILMLGFAGYAVLDQYWYQNVEMSKFEAVAVSVPPKPPAFVAAPIAVGGVIGELEVPRLKLKAMVVQGDSEQMLRRAVGHLPETALPGEAGNVALAGHRDGIFRPLRNVLPGDLITFRTPDREFQYQVEWTAVVPPTAVRVIEPTSDPAMTLITCFPFYYVGAAPERFVVRARRISALPSPPGAP
ncbi:MAG: class D sortase [Acidobacteriia bacterium]|nr:class D sortase [Terriglobia bacterium]